MKDPYETLGVPRSASADEIKKSYRRLAKQYHPDVNKNKGAEDRFKEVSQAYDVLGDTEKRKKFDQIGQWADQGGFDPSQAHRTYTWTSGAPGGGRPGGFDPGNIDFDLGDIFGDLMGQRGARRGRDIISNLEVDFMEAARGTKRRITMERGGRHEKLDVKIPAGVRSGAKIRLAGKGESGQGGTGDLIIRIDVKPHPEFWREDDDLCVEVPLSITQAALGHSIDVPTLDGQVSLKIPAGTSSGQKFRLKGKGFPPRDGSGAGDQLVLVKIVTPKNLSAKAKGLLKELAEELD